MWSLYVILFPYVVLHFSFSLEIFIVAIYNIIGYFIVLCQCWSHAQLKDGNIKFKASCKKLSILQQVLY